MAPFQVIQVILGILFLAYGISGFFCGSRFRQWYRPIVGSVGVACTIFYLATTAHCTGWCL